MGPNRETTDNDGATPESEIACCKVGRTASAIGRTDVLAELASRRKNGESLRDIATYFNIQVVEQVLDQSVETGRSIHAAVVGDELAHEVYRILRGERNSDIRRAELRTRLSDAGVDVEHLEALFVSHVTIRSHLQECAAVETPESTPPFEQIVNTTQGAQIRASNVIQSSLDRAVRHGHLRTGPLEVEVPVRVTCKECGDTFYMSELLDDRECSCTESSS